MSAIHDAGLALAGLLDSIDDGKLRQVIRLVEASGQRRTLEPALADLRPRLRRLRPQRPLSLRRLLTIPFAAALDDGPGQPSSFSIARDRLGLWQQLVRERLAPETVDAARAAIAGRAADDEAAILEAGRRCWPEAARALVAETAPGETGVIQAERLRVADLLAIGDALLPCLARLRPPLTAGDEDDCATLAAVLALAKNGSPDRLGVLASLLLRRACQPIAMAPWLVDLAPAVLRRHLQPILQRLVQEHRVQLSRRLTELEVDPALPLGGLVDELDRLAVALTQPRTPAATGFGELRRKAAGLGRERYAAAIDSVLAPLPPADTARRAAAAKAREETARRLARLACIVRRLARESALRELTGRAVERLVDLETRRQDSGRPLVAVDDARLIEILAGPDVAWHYLRPDAGSGPGGAGPRSASDRAQAGD